MHSIQNGRGATVAIIGLLASIWVGCGPSERLAAHELPPNVLIVVLDTVRRDHLSTYGYQIETTPNLTAFAQSGELYADVLAPAPWTIPSHASLMTGLSPAVHGAHHEHPALDEGFTTLAERFREAGYDTAGFSANPFVGPPSRLDQGFDEFQRIDGGGAAVTAAGVAFMEESQGPWFVFLNYMEAHMPYNGLPESTRLRFMPDTDEETRFAALTAQAEAHRFACGKGRADEALVADVNRLYDAALAHLDELIGVLMAGIEPWRHDTLVVVTADHGELLGEHGRVEHQWALYEPLLRVPLLVRFPGRVDAGSRNDTPMGLEHVHDLVLDLSRLHGDSEQNPRNGTRTGRVASYYRPLRLLNRVRKSEPDCAATLDRRLASVQVGALKLVMGSDGSRALYDLAADPGERRNLASSRADLVSSLEASFRERGDSGRREILEEDVPPLDDETRRRLESLGYATDE